MRKLITFCRALFSATAHFFARRDPVISVSPSGHTVLKGWEECPEETLLKEFNRFEERPIHAPKYALYCSKGSHEGEVFFLSRSVETLGASPLDSIVITPVGGAATGFYQFLVNGSLHLASSVGSSFLLNHSEEHKATLFDFDQIEVAGNRFLVLDLGAASPATKGGRLTS